MALLSRWPEGRVQWLLIFFLTLAGYVGLAAYTGLTVYAIGTHICGIVALVWLWSLPAAPSIHGDRDQPVSKARIAWIVCFALFLVPHVFLPLVARRLRESAPYDAGVPLETIAFLAFCVGWMVLILLLPSRPPETYVAWKVIVFAGTGAWYACWVMARWWYVEALLLHAAFVAWLPLAWWLTPPRRSSLAQALAGLVIASVGVVGFIQGRPSAVIAKSHRLAVERCGDREYQDVLWRGFWHNVTSPRRVSAEEAPELVEDVRDRRRGWGRSAWLLANARGLAREGDIAAAEYRSTGWLGTTAASPPHPWQPDNAASAVESIADEHRRRAIAERLRMVVLEDAEPRR